MDNQNTLNSICLKIIKYGIFTSLLTPLIYSSKYYFPFVAPKSLFFMAIVEIVFFTWLFLAFHNKKYRPNLNIIVTAVLLFIGAMTLSSVMGVDFANSFWSKYERMTGLLMYFHLFALFLTLISTFKEKKDWKELFAVSIGVGLLIAIFSYMEQLGFKNLALSSKKGATLGNTSFLGSYMIFNVFFAIYLFFKTKNITWKAIWIAAAIFMIPAIYVAGARAATVAVFGGIALMGLLYLIFKPKEKKIRVAGVALLIISALLISGVGALLLHPGNELWFEEEGTKLHQTENFLRTKFVNLTNKARFIVWDAGYKGFKKKPVFGWGPENYKYVFIRDFNPCMFTERCGSVPWFDRAHNVLYDRLATTGIVGILSYAFLFLSALWVLWKNYLKKKLDFWTASIFTALLAGYLVQNFTVFDMPTSYMVFFVTLGFISFLIPNKEEREDRFSEISPFATFFLVIFFIGSLNYFIIKPVQANKLMIQSISVQQPDQKVELLEKAYNTSNMGKYQKRTFLARNIKNYIQQSSNQLTNQQMNEMLKLITNRLEKTREETIGDYRTSLELGKTYTLIRQYEKANEALQEAKNISPTNQQAYWELVKLEAGRKDYEKALEYAKYTIELESELFQSHSLALQVAKMMGDQEEIQKLKEKALEINPNWEKSIEQILNPQQK